MNYFIDGTIISIGPIQNFANNFKKREFVIKSRDGNDEIKLEWHNDPVWVMDHYAIGEKVSIAFILKGSSGNGRHFVNLKAIAICDMLPRTKYENNKPKADYQYLKDLINEGKYVG